MILLSQTDWWNVERQQNGLRQVDMKIKKVEPEVKNDKKRRVVAAKERENNIWGVSGKQCAAVDHPGHPPLKILRHLAGVTTLFTRILGSTGTLPGIVYSSSSSFTFPCFSFGCGDPLPPQPGHQGLSVFYLPLSSLFHPKPRLYRITMCYCWVYIHHRGCEICKPLRSSSRSSTRSNRLRLTLAHSFIHSTNLRVQLKRESQPRCQSIVVLFGEKGPPRIEPPYSSFSFFLTLCIQ